MSAGDIIVVLTVVFLIAAPVAWLLMPNLRTWIERPKYQFQENLKRHARGDMK